MGSISTEHDAVPKPSIIDGVKTFIPLENNPATLSHLSSLFGVRNVSFYDIFSLTELSINPSIPRPVHALIFLCPSSVWSRLHPENPDNEIREKGPIARVSPLPHTEGSITWFPQTIGHACGTMALLHALMHIPSASLSSYVPDSSMLASILTSGPSMTPTARAKMLYDSAGLQTAHMTAASQGDSHAPTPEDECVHHFICYVKGKDNCLWEIEGMREGVLNLGAIETDEDVYSERLLALGPGRYTEEAGKTGEHDFSCVAMCLDAES